MRFSKTTPAVRSQAARKSSDTTTHRGRRGRRRGRRRRNTHGPNHT